RSGSRRWHDEEKAPRVLGDDHRLAERGQRNWPDEPLDEWLDGATGPDPRDAPAQVVERIQHVGAGGDDGARPAELRQPGDRPVRPEAVDHAIAAAGHEVSRRERGETAVPRKNGLPPS